MNPACVSVWMNGSDVQFPLLHTYWSVLQRFSVSLNKDINTWTTSPKLLLLSIIEHLTVSFEKNLKSYHIYTYKQNSPWQPVKIKVWFNLKKLWKKYYYYYITIIQYNVWLHIIITLIIIIHNNNTIIIKTWLFFRKLSYNFSSMF